MKQIDECLDRVFSGKEPLKKKWKGFIREHEGLKILYIYHYQHLILRVLLNNNAGGSIISAWYQTDTDRRGLVACGEYLVAKNIIKKTHLKDVLSSMNPC